MAAHIGNKFWELRLSHGRDHAIETPEELWDNFVEYAEWIEQNPLIETDFRGKDAVEVQIPKMRPMTKEGFALACGLSEWRVISEWKDRKGFSQIITRIERHIYDQKLVGAACGFFNANIIARDLGLTDKKEIDATVNAPLVITLDSDSTNQETK
jgi:hypothetical protein